MFKLAKWWSRLLETNLNSVKVSHLLSSQKNFLNNLDLSARFSDLFSARHTNKHIKGQHFLKCFSIDRSKRRIVEENFDNLRRSEQKRYVSDDFVGWVVWIYQFRVIVSYSSIWKSKFWMLVQFVLQLNLNCAKLSACTLKKPQVVCANVYQKPSLVCLLAVDLRESLRRWRSSFLQKERSRENLILKFEIWNMKFVIGFGFGFEMFARCAHLLQTSDFSTAI